MKKILIFLSLIFMTGLVLAHNIELDNETNYPQSKLGKIAVQWAVSVKEVQELNKNILNGSTLNPSTLMRLTQKGKTWLSSPNSARYFRVVVWSSDKQEPDLLTNWVNIIPNKTYVVNQNQLVQPELMAGTGC